MIIKMGGFIVFIFRLLWAAIKASFVTVLVGGFAFLVLAIAQLLLGISDGVVMTLLFVIVGGCFAWLTFDNYQEAMFDKWADASLQVMKNNYKKEFGKEYVRDEKIPGIDYKLPEDEEYIVEGKWTGMPQYRIKNRANKDEIIIEDYWTGMPTSKIRKK